MWDDQGRRRPSEEQVLLSYVYGPLTWAPRSALSTRTPSGSSRLRPKDKDAAVVLPVKSNHSRRLDVKAVSGETRPHYSWLITWRWSGAVALVDWATFSFVSSVGSDKSVSCTSRRPFMLHHEGVSWGSARRRKEATVYGTKATRWFCVSTRKTSWRCPAPSRRSKNPRTALFSGCVMSSVSAQITYWNVPLYAVCYICTICHTFKLKKLIWQVLTWILRNIIYLFIKYYKTTRAVNFTCLLMSRIQYPAICTNQYWTWKNGRFVFLPWAAATKWKSPPPPLLFLWSKVNPTIVWQTPERTHPHPVSTLGFTQWISYAARFKSPDTTRLQTQNHLIFRLRITTDSSHSPPLAFKRSPPPSVKQQEFQPRGEAPRSPVTVVRSLTAWMLLDLRLSGGSLHTKPCLFVNRALRWKFSTLTLRTCESPCSPVFHFYFLSSKCVVDCLCLLWIEKTHPPTKVLHGIKQVRKPKLAADLELLAVANFLTFSIVPVC